MKYKHLNQIKIKAASGGERPRYFLNGESQPIEIIELFYLFLVSKGGAYSYNTINRYLPAVAHFVDYLQEFGVIQGITNPAKLSALITDYQLLCQNSIEHSDALAKWKAEVEFPTYAKSSLLPVFGALNIFLDFIESEAEADIYAANKLGAVYISNIPVKIIKTFNNQTQHSIDEQNRIKSVSWLAGCIRSWRFVEKQKKATPFVTKRIKNKGGENELHFPIGCLPFRPGEAKPRTYFESLLEHTKTFRDKSIFILFAWAGLRTHECLNMLTFDICPDLEPEEGRIKIICPQDRKEAHFDGRPLPSKGRKSAIAIMPPHWEGMFYENLQKYLEQEYDYNTEHNFLFQILKGKKKGEPLAHSQSQMTRNMKNAIKRARNNGDLIPGKRTDSNYLWCDHSLRHHYGMWMRNYQPTGTDENGNILRGFSLTQVQEMMGHNDEESTKIYAQYDIVNIIKTLSSVDLPWGSST